MQKLYLLICLFVYWIIGLFIYSSSAFAQSPAPGAISVSPSIIHLDLATDAPEADLTYTNNTAATVEFQLSASDFTELEDGYKISFLQGKDAQNYHYSLSSWIKFDATDVTINPGESKTVKVFVDKDALTTGGHYGTILAEWVQKENEGNVHVKAILSSLLFVRTAHGNEREEMSVSQFSPLQNLFFFPESFTVKLKNTGNVDLTPHGTVEIQDAFHRTVARGIFNEDSLITLPETIRRYTLPIIPQTTVILPGFYHADLSIRYGEEDKRLYQSATFFSLGIIPYLPWGVVGIILLISIVGMWRKRTSLKRRGKSKNQADLNT